MPRYFFLSFLLILLFFDLVTVQIAQAVPSAQQDVWRVDLRPVAEIKVSEQSLLKLKYYRWINNRWQISDAETFFQTQQAEYPLIFLALGYTLTSQETTAVGHAILRKFDTTKPCRVVYWDWYSEKEIPKIRRDIRNKIAVAENAADYLAYFLRELKPQSKACLFGFSFGCRIVCQAAEVLRVCEQRPEELRLNIVLSGAASDQNWFAYGQRHGNVPAIVEKILVTHNPDDISLRFYPLIYPFRHKPTALGVSGVPIQSVAPEYRDRFENLNVERYVGRKHETLGHVGCAAFRSRINKYFFFE